MSVKVRPHFRDCLAHNIVWRGRDPSWPASCRRVSAVVASRRIGDLSQLQVLRTPATASRVGRPLAKAAMADVLAAASPASTSAAQDDPGDEVHLRDDVLLPMLTELLQTMAVQ